MSKVSQTIASVPDIVCWSLTATDPVTSRGSRLFIAFWAID